MVRLYTNWSEWCDQILSIDDSDIISGDNIDTAYLNGSQIGMFNYNTGRGWAKAAN